MSGRSVRPNTHLNCIREIKSGNVMIDASTFSQLFDESSSGISDYYQIDLQVLSVFVDLYIRVYFAIFQYRLYLFAIFATAAHKKSLYKINC